MLLNELGEIALSEWNALPAQFPFIELDEFQIMPNHMHGIISLNPQKAGSITIGDIICVYKSLVFNKCLEIFKKQNQIMGKLWQRSFHDHIIRDNKSYQNIVNYIINNPENWGDDEYYRD